MSFTLIKNQFDLFSRSGTIKIESGGMRIGDIKWINKDSALGKSTMVYEYNIKNGQYDIFLYWIDLPRLGKRPRETRLLSVLIAEKDYLFKNRDSYTFERIARMGIDMTKLVIVDPTTKFSEKFLDSIKLKDLPLIEKHGAILPSGMGGKYDIYGHKTGDHKVLFIDLILDPILERYNISSPFITPTKKVQSSNQAVIYDDDTHISVIKVKRKTSKKGTRKRLGSKKRSIKRGSRGNKKGSRTKRVRPSPSQSATKFKEGTVKRGNDGNKWKIVVNKAGVQRWQKVKPRPSPSQSATSFKPGTIMKGNDGSMWEIVVNKAGVQRWQKIN